MRENTSRQLPLTNYRLPILNLLSFFCHLSGSKIDGKTFYFTARAWLSHVLPLLLLASSMMSAMTTKTCLLMAYMNDFHTAPITYVQLNSA
ncbi:hypothetical protein IQ272_07445 [Chroococcidiopsidales cyanobacterium LEGE 13417]|nr:hypothetical protein [Chroococcidiopsidales cyanobacterium LEGE 13417]